MDFLLSRRVYRFIAHLIVCPLPFLITVRGPMYVIAQCGCGCVTAKITVGDPEDQTVITTVASECAECYCNGGDYTKCPHHSKEESSRSVESGAENGSSDRRVVPFESKLSKKAVRRQSRLKVPEETNLAG